MSNTNLTFSTPIIDVLGNAFCALGNFKNRGGHAAMVEVYTHLSGVPGSDYVFDSISDVLLKSRGNTETSPANGQAIPVVLAMPMASGVVPTLDTSAIASSSGGLIEIDFDAQTSNSNTLEIGKIFPYGSLDRPL